MSKKTIRICVVDTVYTLFLYLVKFGYDKSDYFVVSSGIPEDIRKDLNHYYFSKPEFHYSTEKDRFMDMNRNTIGPNLTHIFKLLKLKSVLFFKTFNKDVEVYGQGHLKFSFPLYKWSQNAIIEDGLGNYAELKVPYTFKHPKIANFFGFYFKFFREGFGTHKNIKQIYLTRENSPDIVRDKVEVMDVKKLWDEKTEYEKDEIINLFKLNDIYDRLDEESVILITQPLSEDKRMSLEEEMNIYKKFIDKYPNLIIKTHPRESKNYSELLDGVAVIDIPFPMELLKFMGIKISRILTVSSTVALNFRDECEIEIYDGETSSKVINEGIKLIKKELE